MLNASLHPRLLIPFLAALIASAAWAAYGVTPISDPTNRLQSVSLKERPESGPSADWLGAVFERLVVKGDSAELKDDNDDERNDVRKHAPHGFLGNSCHTADLPRPAALIETDFDPRGHSPGARRGPPPRMPPL